MGQEHRCAVADDARRPWRASRRVIMKAAAAFSALAASGGVAGTIAPRVLAQDTDALPETRAGRWFQADNAATFSAAAAGEPKIAQADFPFYAVGVHWDSDVGTWPRIELSFGVNGVDFTDPVIVAADIEDAPLTAPSPREFSNLAFADGAEFIRYRVLDENDNPVDLPSLGITYIDAVTGFPQEADNAFVAAAQPTLQKPTVVSRAGWGANESYRFDSIGEAWVREYRQVKHVIIHHTVTAQGTSFDSCKGIVRSIYFYHAVERGWGDIGYNYLVDFLGHIYEGRAGGENVVGGHAYQYAFGSSGIGTIGNFTMSDVSEACQSAIVAITAWTGRNLNPLGKSDFLEAPDLPTICGHRDVTQDTCPGDALYADLPGIRQAVKAILDATESPANPPVDPPPGEFVTGANVITTAKVNLRYEPSLSADVNAALPQGELAAVIGAPRNNEGRIWYPLRTRNYGDGYVSGSFLDFAPTGNPPGPKFNVGDFVRVNTNGLSLRSRPGVAQTVIATIPSGATLELTVASIAANGYRWWGVYNKTYGGGWVVQDYLQSTAPPNPQFKVGDDVVVNTDALYLRSGPGTGYSVIATMPSGTRGEVIGGPSSGNGFVWYKLSTGFGQGWAAAQYLSLDDAPPPSTKFQIGDNVEVVASVGLNLRLAPSRSAKTVASMPTGTVGEVIGGPTSADGYIWWQITTSLGVGWAIERFLEETDEPPPPPGDFNVGDTVECVASTSVNMRSSPSTSARTIAKIPRGTVGVVIDGPTNANGYTWWRVQTAIATGWIMGKFWVLSDEEPPATGKFQIGDTVRVDTDALNLRSSASTSGSVVAVLPTGAQLTVIGGPQNGSGYTWWRLQSATYGTGWSVQDYLTEV